MGQFKEEIRKENILNLPNLITAIRLVLMPFFVYAILHGKSGLALLFFTVILMTDKLDGYWARMTHQMTDFGRLLDGFADGIINATTVFLLVYLERISIFWMIVLLLPKLTNFICELVYIRRNKKLKLFVTNKARAGTAFLYLSMVAGIIDFEYKEIVFLATAVVLYVGGIEYLYRSIYKNYPT